jgi:hypothetical protein
MRLLVRLMGGSEHSLDAAMAYLNVIFSSAIMIWVFNSLINVILGTGNHRAAGPRKYHTIEVGGGWLGRKPAAAACGARDCPERDRPAASSERCLRMHAPSGGTYARGQLRAERSNCIMCRCSTTDCLDAA